MGKSASQTKRLTPEARKTQLLGAARTLLTKQRHLPLSFEAIAASANVSPPLVYNYFPDASALYNLIAQQDLCALHDALTNANETLEGAASAYFDYLTEQGTALTTILSDPSMTGKLSPATLLLRNAHLRRFASIIRRETGCTIREAILTILSFTAIPEELAIQVRQNALDVDEARSYVNQLARLSVRTLRKQSRTA